MRREVVGHAVRRVNDAIWRAAVSGRPPRGALRRFRSWLRSGASADPTGPTTARAVLLHLQRPAARGLRADERDVVAPGLERTGGDRELDNVVAVTREQFAGDLLVIRRDDQFVLAQ